MTSRIFYQYFGATHLRSDYHLNDLITGKPVFIAGNDPLNACTSEMESLLQKIVEK
ncbi:MAG: hypothetical protein QM536_08330 [Chitinophagaceae bacterium]|nr:hypothetical protein [Chitinophagaceae bacterium]